MTQRIVVDPITRIEGHLRIEVDINAQGNITNALSAGTQVRGIEIILRNRDPRDAWAFAHRICGVCTLVHGLASVRAVEDALSIEVPENGELIRDLMAASARSSPPRKNSSMTSICQTSSPSAAPTRTGSPAARTSVIS